MLNQVLPRAQLEARFGSRLILEEYHKADMGQLVRAYPEGVFGIGANVWNRIVSKGWNHVNPRAMSSYFDGSNPRMPLAIGRLIQEEIIEDIYYVKGWDGTRTDDRLVVQLLVAKVYRNDLHLADVAFTDPDRPLAESARRSEHQTHVGLGLLPALMENLEAEAIAQSCSEITLTSTTLENVALFERYGFQVEDSNTGRMAMGAGYGIPMEKVP